MQTKRLMGLSFAVSFIMMIAAPFVAVRIINGEAGFAFVFISFMWVNPVIAAINGAVAGKNIKENWSIIFFPPALFLISAKVVFQAQMAEFSFYSLLYLAVGAVTMVISSLIAMKGRKKKAAEASSEADNTES